MRYTLILCAISLCLCSLFGCNNSNSSQSNNASPQGNTASASPTPKKDTKHFVNPCETSPCVKFSFDYPESWVMRPNFTANLSDDSKYATFDDKGDPYNEPFDNINIREDQADKTMEDAKSNAAVAVAGLSPEYKRISKGEIRIGSYDSYQITVKHPKAGVDRMIYIPQPGGGLEIRIHDASSAPEIKGFDDPGQLGRYNMILNSLKIGS